MDCITDTQIIDLKDSLSDLFDESGVFKILDDMHTEVDKVLNSVNDVHQCIHCKDIHND